MNFIKRAHREDYVNRLPLIAMIDVVLFLLFYFIMAGSLADPESDLSAAISPSPRGSGIGNDFASQIVYVENDGGRTRFRVAAQTMYEKAALSELLARLPKDPGVIIKVADDCDVAAAAAAVQATKDAGFTRVTYVAGN